MRVGNISLRGSNVQVILTELSVALAIPMTVVKVDVLPIVELGRVADQSRDRVGGGEDAFAGR